MTDKTQRQKEKLVSLLKELFQLDQPDLLFTEDTPIQPNSPYA